MTTLTSSPSSPAQRFQDQIAAHRDLSDEEFALLDPSTLTSILVPVRVQFATGPDPSSSVKG